MKPYNPGGHSAYQERVLAGLRKYYPDTASSLPHSTWAIIEKFRSLDPLEFDILMADRYFVFGPAPRLPSDSRTRTQKTSFSGGNVDCTCENPSSTTKYERIVHLLMKDNPRLFKNPPRSSREWKLEYNARTSAECCNKCEKVDCKLEYGRYRSSKM